MDGSVKLKRVAAASLAAALLLPPAFSAFGSEGGTLVKPGSRAAAEKSCIRPVAEMRRNHMELLKHKRDDVMHRGIRTVDASITECIACHAVRTESGGFVPVNEEGQFCSECHEKAAAKLDCFDCHRTTPDPKEP